MSRTILKTKRFQKNFKELPSHIQLKFKEIIPSFVQDPFLPFLKTHKLKGNLEGLYSSSISHNYRFVTIIDFEKQEMTFVNVGTHAIYQ
ncbi:type II toxin-antitoxin system mRNA interferase toxin, RelE/StbE family [bacterium]|nr:type II toxin-antitoxin system mRNA interferase toxin, RelE/StbE family [bacterium]